ncbi:MAG TPA: hypothetical protein VGO03_20890, partial [Acidimicrobiia bacterium]
SVHPLQPDTGVDSPPTHNSSEVARCRPSRNQDVGTSGVRSRTDKIDPIGCRRRRNIGVVANHDRTRDQRGGNEHRRRPAAYETTPDHVGPLLAAHLTRELRQQNGARPANGLGLNSHDVNETNSAIGHYLDA